MALEIDIKPNDDFEKAALSAAKALDQIAAKEKQIDALSKRLGVSSKQVVAAQNHLASEQANREKKILELEKKKTKEEFAFRDKIKTASVGLIAMKEIAGDLLDKTVEIGKSLFEMSFEASQSRKEARAMIDAFTHGRGDETIKVLDQWAKKLGLSFEETRDKFVEFRQAGMDNRMSLNLIKMRADLMAMGMSAKTADAQIAHVTAAGHDRYAAARAFIQVQRAFKGVGDGAKAAEFATHSFEAAQNHLKNVVNNKLADFWDKVGPSIGNAANRLADFLDSAAGGATLDAIADAVTGLADAFNSENFTTAVNVVKAIASAFEEVGEWIGEAASDVVDFVNSALPDITSFGGAVADAFSVIWDLDKKMVDFGSKIVDGLVSGMKAGLSNLGEAAKVMAKGIAGPFADMLGIHSPSKLFAGFGENTVEGFQLGQDKALGSGEMPIMSAASKAPQGNSSGGGDVTINLTVNGGGNASEIARSVRQEIALLLQAGSLSRGLA